MKAQFTFFLNNIITQHLIPATKDWSRHKLVMSQNVTSQNVTSQIRLSINVKHSWYS